MNRKSENRRSERRGAGGSGLVFLVAVAAVVLSFLWQMAMGICPVP